MNKYMAGYFDQRTMYHPERIAAWQRGDYFPPVLAEISPTGRCNQKCRYCYAMTRIEQIHMDDDLLMRLPKELEQAGVKALLYQGDGDPLMHNKLADAINTTALPQTISTNGVLFTPEFQDKCIDKLHYVRFSVIDSDPQRYAYQHGTIEKQHEMLIDNLKYAVAHRKRTMLMASVYLEPYNFDFAYDIVKFFKDLGMDYLVVQEAIYYDQSPVGRQPFTSEGYTDNQIQMMKHAVGSLNDNDFVVRFRFPNGDMKTGVTCDTFYPGFCEGIKFEAVIAPDGSVIPCWRAWDKPELSFGNLHEHSFEEIWRGFKRVEVTDWVLNTPPEGEECRICNQYKTNQTLEDYRHRTDWSNFLL